jgi:hypothetical protein
MLEGAITFSPGESVLSPEFTEKLNRLAETVSTIEQFAKAKASHYLPGIDMEMCDAIAEEDPPPVKEFFPAVIIGATALNGSDRQFTYTLRRIRFLTGATYEEATDLQPFEFPAFCMDEMGHTDQYAYGVDTDGTDYAANSIVPQPAGGGGTTTAWRYELPVWVKSVTLADTRETVYLFSKGGGHDGNCA